MPRLGPEDLLVDKVWPKAIVAGHQSLFVASGRKLSRELDAHNELVVIKDVDKPMQRSVRHVPLPEMPVGLALGHSALLVADGQAGLMVFDVAALGLSPSPGNRRLLFLPTLRQDAN